MLHPPEQTSHPTSFLRLCPVYSCSLQSVFVAASSLATQSVTWTETRHAKRAGPARLRPLPEDLPPQYQHPTWYFISTALYCAFSNSMRPAPNPYGYSNVPQQQSSWHQAGPPPPPPALGDSMPVCISLLPAKHPSLTKSSAAGPNHVQQPAHTTAIPAG